MPYHPVRSFGAIIVGAVLLATAARAQDVVEVTATGQGITEESARRDALRQALEKGGAVEIASHSETRNFELVRDTIFSRADGIITDYRVVEKGDAAGGVKYCTIVAKVSKSALASTWGEVQNVLEQLGRPVIAVYIQERIDGQLQDSSILESQIEKRLLDAGFVVKAGEQIHAIADKELADAQSEENVAKMRAIAKDFGAQIFLTGTAQANAAGVRDLFGEPTAMYNGDAMVKTYYTDTAQLLASESLANWRGGARGYRERSPQAGKKALENAAQTLADDVYASVMRNWATAISAGREVELEVEGISVVGALKLKQKLLQIDPDRIVNVNQSVTKGIATFRIQAKMSAEDLATHLIGEEFAPMIELVDLKANRIQAKWVGG